MATSNKNLMPSFAQGTYVNIQKLISDGKVNAPAFIFFTDRESLGFLDSKGTLHSILWEKMVEIETQLDGLNDPTTGQPIKVTEYVNDTVAPVSQEVEIIKEKVGTVIMLTSDEEVS